MSRPNKGSVPRRRSCRDYVAEHFETIEARKNEGKSYNEQWNDLLLAGEPVGTSPTTFLEAIKWARSKRGGVATPVVAIASASIATASLPALATESEHRNNAPASKVHVDYSDSRFRSDW